MKKKTKTLLLVGGGAAALLLYLQSRSQARTPIAAATGFKLGGFLNSVAASVTAATSGLAAGIGKLLGGQPLPDAGGRYTFSQANGVTLKTTSPPPWLKGQVSGWSCWDGAGKPVPMSDPRCSNQVEAFTVLEGTGRTAMGSLRTRRNGSLGSSGLGSLGRS